MENTDINIKRCFKVYCLDIIMHTRPRLVRIIQILNNGASIKGSFPGKWHVFVLALLYIFECLNE